MKKQKRLDKSLVIRIITLSLFFIVAIAVTVWSFPYIMQLDDTAVQEYYRQKIESFGWGGFFVMVGVQIVQVVFAIIPGEPIEIISGLLYGGIGGALICVIGVLIGTIIIYYLVKIFGKPLVDCFASPKFFEKMRILNAKRRVERLMLILFFIPGVPKDILTYIAPLTPIKASRFLLIATVARIPAILTATFVGAAIYNGNYLFTILLFVVATVLTGVGILIERFIISHFQKKRNKNVENTNTINTDCLNKNKKRGV